MRSTLILLMVFALFGCKAQVFSTDKKSKTGRVQPYWQQHVDYTMDIKMNVHTYRFTGVQKLVYTNNSPDALHKVFYHLYFNAFQPGSEMDARLQSIADPDRRMVTYTREGEKPKSRIAALKPGETGYLHVKKLSCRGKTLTYKVEGTILEVRLQHPIQPGEKVVFDMEFEGQVPVQIRRSGRNNKDGVALSMTQWYPKMATYDIEGWHADPYIGREFYGEWGNFDVRIHIDKNYMLGGTGYLQNPQEVGFGYAGKLPLHLPQSEEYTWHFIAENVHDFTWVADPGFVHDIMYTAKGVALHFLYKNKPETQKVWRKMEPIAVQTMDFYSDYIGEYPYKQYAIIQGGDGGMEYAMCTLISGSRSFKSLAGTMMHEMGHAWFQFMLATNESEHPWMDEGFTSFVEAVASDKIMHNKGDFIFESAYNYYNYMVHTGQEEPLTTHSDRYATNMSYSINAYDKGSVFLAQLAYVIGWENLEKTLKSYFEHWAGKHPGPNDFMRIAEEVSGLELHWYLNEFAETTHFIDYAVKSIDGNRIQLERLGSMPMPIDVQVFYQDGTKDNYYIPLNLMRGEKPTTAHLLPDWDFGHQYYRFTTPKEIAKVQIDPSLLMADIDRKNNVLLK